MIKLVEEAAEYIRQGEDMYQECMDSREEITRLKRENQRLNTVNKVLHEEYNRLIQ